MSNDLNVYPVFEDNQVLTSTQLNEMVTYLDEQGRLTRGSLLGTGLVCGFGIKYGVNNQSQYYISIDDGIGVTSLGDVIRLGACTMKRYRSYSLPQGASYSLFTYSPAATLYELLEDDVEKMSTETFYNLDANFCSDKAVILFLETVDVDLKSCLGKSCDENGKERVFNVRKLLVSKSDLINIQLRTISDPVPFIDKFGLPEIYIKRPLFDPVTPASGQLPEITYTAFTSAYSSALQNPGLNAGIANGLSIVTVFFNTMRSVYNCFSPFLSKEFPTDPFLTTPSSWTNFANAGTGNGPSYLGVQYFYDMMKDMVQAYNEFRQYANELLEECCCNSGAFPKHVMIGEVYPADISKPSDYRHGFYPSPLINNQSMKADAAMFYYKRLVLMMHKFDLDLINNPNTSSVAIRITPNNDRMGRLSRRSIPYYFKANDADTALSNLTLTKTWNYNYKTNGFLSKQVQPYSYHNSSYSTLSPNGIGVTPLYYDIDNYDSFRVEGHIRADIDAGKTAIESLRDAFDLPFNVIKLRLNGAVSGSQIAARYSFEDLQLQYGSLRKQVLSLFNDMILAFKNPSSASTAPKSLPTFIASLIANSGQGSDQNSVGQPQTGVGGSVLIDPTSVAFSLPSVSDSSVVPSDIKTGASSLNMTAVFGTQPFTINTSGPVFATKRNLAQIKSAYESTASSGSTQSLINSLLALINNTGNCLPYSIKDLDCGINDSGALTGTGFLKYYLDALQRAIELKVLFNQMIDVVIHNQKLKSETELYMSLSSYWREVGGLLENFIKDSRYQSLLYIYSNYAYRINYMKENDSSLLSNFIKKHPGVEHNGTVKRGGTLVLVNNGSSAASNTISANQVIADFSLPYRVENNDEMQAIPSMTSAKDLNVPAISVPYYVEFGLGDYAFAKNVNIGAHNILTTNNWMAFDIISQLQYDKTVFAPTQVRLYLVDIDGSATGTIGKKGYTLFSALLGRYHTGYMATYNKAYLPANTQQVGTATVLSPVSSVSDSTYKTQLIAYTPYTTPTGVGGGDFSGGVDSFYYMFELVAENSSVVLKRSNIGVITVNIDKTTDSLLYAFGSTSDPQE